MKNGISINERIFDLRVDKDLTQAELAEALDIPVTTYCDYEREGNPVPHTLVVALAKYYGVSADYILGLSTNREPENIPLQSLCISDSAADFLRDEDTNSRLLSEIISHPAFRQFLIDAEVYVDGYVDDAIQTYNLMMDTGRAKVAEASDGKHDPQTEALEKIRLVQDDYFAQILSRDLLPVLADIKSAHKKDAGTSDAMFDASLIQTLTDTVQNQSGGKVKKMAALINAIMNMRKTSSNMETAEKTLEDPSPENISEVINRSDLIEPNPRKRKSDD